MQLRVGNRFHVDSLVDRLPPLIVRCFNSAQLTTLGIKGHRRPEIDVATELDVLFELRLRLPSDYKALQTERSRPGEFEVNEWFVIGPDRRRSMVVRLEMSSHFFTLFVDLRDIRVPAEND